MTIRAIETRYAGCHFRSRLEARWAKFFDRAEIRWEYEPQGFELPYRLTDPGNSETTFRYLPDFWLPDLSVWAEVKGELSNDETVRLLNAAAALSSNGGSGCHDAGGHDLAVFGPLTRGGTLLNSPVRLHLHKGDLFGTCLWCDHHVRSGETWLVGNDYEALEPAWGQQLLDGIACLEHANTYAHPLAVARAARFEFGARR